MDLSLVPTSLCAKMRVHIGHCHTLQCSVGQIEKIDELRDICCACASRPIGFGSCDNSHSKHRSRTWLIKPCLINSRAGVNSRRPKKLTCTYFGGGITIASARRACVQYPPSLQKRLPLNSSLSLFLAMTAIYWPDQAISRIG